MEPSATRSSSPFASVTTDDSLGVCPNAQSPSSVVITAGSSIGPASQRPEQQLDSQTGDRSGLAVRLVRKTRTNFLLSGSKKSRKSKAIPVNLSSEPTVKLSEETIASNPPELGNEEHKRDKHSKTKSHTDTTFKSKSRSSLRKKSGRAPKVKSSDGYASEEKGTASNPVFGVPLDIAYERSPSHDGVPLPAFFRHCIDYVEQYGLSSEGLYRVPGVNSQIQALVTALDKGEDFLHIPPTFPLFYQCQDANIKYSSTSRNVCIAATGMSSSDAGSKSKHQAYTGHSDHSTKGAASASSPKRHRSIAVDNRAGSLSARPQLPHDLAVICSVIKYFLRSLPEPVLTNNLRTVIESLSATASTESRTTVYTRLAHLVHQELPRSNRYLLAWLLQHVTHIIDRAGENLMTQANIIIVLSPCLGMSHRLLALLLGSAPSDVNIDLTQLDPSLPQVDLDNASVDPSTWHWLFPHPAYLLRPYRPPLRPGPDLELPETNEELDVELRKQESLLSHLHEQIGRGETSAEKEAFLWEVQRLVTEIRRRKTLVDPDAIRAELSRQQAQLDRLHRAIAQNSVNRGKLGLDPAGFPCANIVDDAPQVNTATGSDTASTLRRRPTTASKSRAEPVSLYSDELWEVQRQVTMLKRRLKQQEKLVASQANPLPSAGTSQGTVRSDSVVAPIGGSVGGIPLVIPSLSELDEEEVLNLTLRKLPLDATPVDTNAEVVPPSSMVALPLGTQPSSTDTVSSSFVDSVTTETSEIPQPEDTAVAAVELVSNPQLAAVPDSNTPVSPAVDEFHHDNIVQQPEQFTVANADLATNTDTTTEEKPFTAAHDTTHETLPTKTHSTTFDEIHEVDSHEAQSVETQQPVERLQSKPLSRGSLYQIALYDARKHELCAIQADLRARIWSEQAEIRQIQSRIDHLLQTGGSRVRRIYESQFAPQDPCLTAASGWREQASRMEHASVWLSRSWTKFADRLNVDVARSPDEREICLMDESDASDGCSGHSFDNGSASLPPGGASDAESAVRKTTPVSYMRLIDNEDGICHGDNLNVDELPPESVRNGTSTASTAKRLDNRKQSQVVFSSPSWSSFQSDHLLDKNGMLASVDDANGGDEIDGVPADDDDSADDDDDDEDDEEEAGEAELARTLHQLTLDNARLEQLNMRYLEGIQAERNRCAELKVLLKLRNIRSMAVSL